MSLVSYEEVSVYLQRPVDYDTAGLAVRIAEGWVRPLVRSEAWPPDPVPDDLWSAVLELAAMAVENPAGMRSTTVQGQTDEWSVARRGEILTEIASRYGAVVPLGSFPPAPVERRC